MSNNFQQKISNNFSLTTLDKADIGTGYVVVSCDLPQPLDVRFAELGFVAGTKVAVNKKAPMGDPLEVTILGYSLCVRANEAKHVTVERERQ